MKLSLPQKISLLASVFLLSTTTTSFSAGSAFHYQLDLTARLVTTDKSELTGIEMSWLYDTELSETLMDGEDLSEANREATLEKRAADILDGLKGVNYFTTLKVDGKDIKLEDVEQYNLRLIDQSRLQLNMTLPLETTTTLKGHLLEVVVSDSSAIGLATFVDPTRLKLDQSIKSSCKKPQLQQSQLGVIDEHIVMSETMTVDCR